MIMRRRQGETILIGGNIEVQIVSIGRSRVKIGINAPKEVVVTAKEVKLVREENLAAATEPQPVQALAAVIASILIQNREIPAQLPA